MSAPALPSLLAGLVMSLGHRNVLHSGSCVYKEAFPRPFCFGLKRAPQIPSCVPGLRMVPQESEALPVGSGLKHPASPAATMRSGSLLGGALRPHNLQRTWK